MSSEQAFGNPLVESMFRGIFAAIDFPLLLILVGVVFTALIQSSSAATGVVITMVGTGVMELDLALFIVLGANIGTCVTALLACAGANANSKRIALIHFTFNTIGTAAFTAIIWIFRQPVIDLLTAFFPGSDAMSLQMRVSVFHVIFNVTTTLMLLPFVKQLVTFSKAIIREKETTEKVRTLRFVDDHMLAMPSVALAQVKQEIDYMLCLAEENTKLSFQAMQTGNNSDSTTIAENEDIIDFTNGALTSFLIKLSAQISASDEATIGAYFHVLNDLERIGDHAVNFFDIAQEMRQKELVYSDNAKTELQTMCNAVLSMFTVAKDAFENHNFARLPELTQCEDQVDEMKKALTAQHYTRLSEGSCSVTHSPYYTSTVMGLERVADHLVNVGYSIQNPTGSQKELR
jgi:phosphate:Na+ symporter